MGRGDVYAYLPLIPVTISNGEGCKEDGGGRDWGGVRRSKKNVLFVCLFVCLFV